MEAITRRKFVGVVGAGAAGLALSNVVSAQGLDNESIASLPVNASVPSPAHPQTWNVKLGGQSDNGEIMFVGFFPSQMWVNIGDSIVWTGNSMELHTATFLAPQQQRPPFDPTDPSQTQQVPPTPLDGTNKFDGRSYTNSGLLAQGQSYTLRFDQAGDFTCYCLMHTLMKSVIHVRPSGTPYPYGQRYYNALAAMQQRTSLLYGEGVRMQSIAQSSSDPQRGYRVSIGGGNGPVVLMRFYPEKITVPVGASVTFTNLDMDAPHTVTFGPEPAPPAQFPPAGDPTAYGDPGQTLSSGFIGLDPNWFGNSFTVTFTQPGTYPYVCILHDEMGMVGTVVVTGR